ncbi:50S ribosomal protein L9 [Thiohalocapsa sp. ML1]|uniref:50S ribosomal protein L9 n=1 Tax=Thiohalocapsa sp. ML1 TaxID=1431688 RepID=UPI00073228DC|nr:50S ribosomal protein L9 [Thiohalocapsa sp. ML1]
MEVILLKKVGGLGELGDKVAVRAGYGRNFLIPQGAAVPATDANLKAFEERRAELEAQAGEALAIAESRRERFEGLTVNISRKAGDEGRLFGSVGTGDIAEAVTAVGVDLAKSEVRLPQGPFRHIGSYEVELHLHTDVDVVILVEIVPGD